MAEEIGQFLHGQREGVLDSEGVFTIDLVRARDKLQHFQLPRADFCWLKLVQAAVVWQTNEVKFITSKRAVRVEFCGPIDFGELTRWPGLFASPLEIGSAGERHLAMGVMGALNLCSELSWSYDLGGQRHSLIIDAKSLSCQSAAAGGGPARLTFTLHRPPDLSVLFERCPCCPVPLTVDGKSVQKVEKPKQPFLMESYRKLESGTGVSVPAPLAKALRPSERVPQHWLGKKSGIWPMKSPPRSWIVECRGLEPGNLARWTVQSYIQLLLDPDPDTSSEVIFVVDGVSMRPIQCRLPFRSKVVAQEPSLSLDLSGFAVVKNEALDLYLDCLGELVASLLAGARVHRDILPPLPLTITDGANETPRMIGSWLAIEKLQNAGGLVKYRAVPAESRSFWEEALLTTYEHVEREEFDRRVRELTAIKHPRIPRLLDQGIVPGSRDVFALPYTVENLAFGRPLDTVVPPEGLELEVALGHLRSVGQIVAELHAQGIQAGIRLRPDNILLGPDGVTLTDFNTPNPPSLECGPSKEELAWLLWLPPEEITGAPSRPVADQYKLGTLGYYLLTGRPPFSSKPIEESHVMAMLYAVLTEMPVDPREHRPELPEGIAAAVLRALSKGPDDRFTGVKEFLDALS